MQTLDLTGRKYGRLTRPAVRVAVYDAIDAEREFQDKKWNRSPGVWPCPDERKYLVLAEEVGEVAKDLLERKPEQARYELVQVAAVAVAWLEALEADDRRAQIEHEEAMKHLQHAPFPGCR